ncbi:MAG: membrane-associated protein [Candidatus Omnitrophica bacterium]|nr:membrane-associated protein [Candidatus Omnitrophota bacterium]
MKLDVKAFGLAGGILWSMYVFILTWMGIFGYGSETAVSIAKAYYIGYSISPLGSVIGAIYGFIDAGIGCVLLALLYNKLVKK